MKLAIFSHCAIDSIIIDDSSFEQIGGAACYASHTARNLKFKVDLFTKFGRDFPKEDYLDKFNIKYGNALSSQPTTRFKIVIQGSERTLFHQNSCEPIDFHLANADGFLFSPIFHEISKELYEKIKNNSNFNFLDPQGFLRRKDSEGKVILEKTDLDVSKISAIKVDPSELTCLVGGYDVESMKKLQKKGIEYILLANKKDISLLAKDRIYSIQLPNLDIYDTTGIGDIFSSTFSCTMIKENDFLWALCFGAGSAQAALESKKIGLQKVPKKGQTETNASYFYNTVKFKQV